ncbi:MAG: glycosyltransferase family 1 protein [Hyphomonas sp.]|nr:glycosyltransferase family 1 protein [Hyphomonas sp.]
MKVSIQTLGSLGDVMPYITTAKRLKVMGIDISILAPRDYTDIIAAHGIDADTPPDFSLHAWNREAEERGTLSGPVTFFRDWNDMVVPHVADIMERCLSASEGADVILANGICAPARLAAEAQGIPYILSALQPVISPTRHVPCAMVWRGWQGGLANRQGYGAVWAARRLMERALKPHRERLGLTGHPSFSDTRTHLGRPLPRVTSVSPALMPQRPADWRSNDHLFAYPSMGLDDTSSMPADLFAASDPEGPPVFVSLGSLERDTGSGATIALFRALRRTGLRAIVSAGSEAGVPADLLDGHRIVPHVSHARVFPECRAVIHHGGAGTADTAIRSASPQIVLPSVLDQFWHAHRLAELGVAPPFPGQGKMDEDWFVRALEFVGQPGVSRKAAGLMIDHKDRDGAMELAEFIRDATKRFRQSGQ